MSHTPGPWTYNCDEEMVCEGFYPVADVFGEANGKQSADQRGRLIAAAPEMAEMLDKLWHFLDAQAKATQNGGARFHISSLAAEVKTLHAKATGGAK